MMRMYSAKCIALILVLGLWHCGGDSGANSSPDAGFPVDAFSLDTIPTGADSAPTSTEPDVQVLPMTYVISFQPESTGVASPAITVAASLAGDDRVIVTVAAQQVPNVFGVAFHLEYDPSILEWVKTTTMDPLTNADANGAYVSRIVSPGVFAYGGARFGSVSKTEATGKPKTGLTLLTGALCDIEFRILTTGQSPLLFSDLRRDLRHTKTADPTNWIGGLLAVSASDQATAGNKKGGQ